MLYSTFGVFLFIESRGMDRGFFVFRGYYSQGPPHGAAASPKGRAIFFSSLFRKSAAV
jgi:hypothetical protein